eukprot:TRINITY_DN8971_c0_g1_i1.p3 TRINITY_DN8971_c0_g1~~TRINITY_DN8971_c0_g1_i1.p3  ORF type:complete len:114 (+),score=20.43 TRINITY_DN8971_c0_g1_i1:125-466(+)
MIRRPPRSTQGVSSAASDVYKRQGYIYVNGKNLGRYYSIIAKGDCEPCDYRMSYNDKKCFTGCNELSQRFFDIPYGWLKYGENILVIFEEVGGDIDGVHVFERQRVSPDLIDQ